MTEFLLGTFCGLSLAEIFYRLKIEKELKKLKENYEVAKKEMREK